MKKVLVTGATGFIGNYVIAELLNKGCKVIATSSSEEKARNFDWYNKVEYIPFDFRNFDNQKNYYEYFSSPELMIHLAWEGLPNYLASFHIETNLPRHKNLLTNLIMHGLKDLTVAGTCLEYGMQEGELVESMEPHPANSYSQAKDLLRRHLEGLRKKIFFDFKWIRLFYMYGKGQSSKSILAQLETAIAKGENTFNMSAGEQTRDYLPVELVASNIVTVALQKKVQGIINCSSGKPITIKQLVANYLSENNASIMLNLGFFPYPDYEPMHFWGNNVKLKSIIGL